jgi:hypothetical protein
MKLMTQHLDARIRHAEAHDAFWGHPEEPGNVLVDAERRKDLAIELLERRLKGAGIYRNC